MSELDDLPSWAGRSTEEVQLPATPPHEIPIADDAVPAPPAMPVDAQPEISAPTAADQAPPSPPPVVEDPPAAQEPPAPPVLAAQPPPAEPTIVQPAAAAVAADPQPAAVAPPMVVTRERSKLRPILFGLLGLAVIAGAAAIGYGLASRDGDATEASGAAATEDPASPEATADADASTGDAATGTDDGADDGAVATDGDATDADGADSEDGTETVTVEVDSTEGEDADADATTDADAAADETGDGDGALNDGNRQAVFRDGQVYLTGAVPSEEIGAQIVAKAEAVVGPGNVINEYTIDPTTTIQPGSSAPLFVEDVVLFEFNSVEVATPFLPILDLGTLLLRQNPQASITVVTRTDAVGSAEVNLEVARQRAQAVINYWLTQGVNPDQIVADPRGEEGASEEDDPETAALQRRAEFIITGLLD